MSKIGKVNLDLQEQANELGFSTIQEALDNGYVAVYNDGDVKIVKEEDWQHEQAHNEWLMERDILLTKLRMLRTQHLSNPVREIIGETIEFIEKREV